MTPVVVDSSVVLKWFVPEGRSDRALRLLDGTFALFAPGLLIPECGNVVWKKITREEITAEDGRSVLKAVGGAPIRLVESSPLVEAALEIAIAFRTTVYDGLYVALAVARECALVTADDRLARALAGSPFAATVRTLAEWDLAGGPKP